MERVPLGDDIIKKYQPFRNTKTKWKKTLISKHTFQVDQRYEIQQLLGQGAYGVVVSARIKDAMDQRMVAIKKIDKAFQHKIFTKRTLRELRLLKLLKHENIIGIQTIMLPKSREQFEDIYVVSELMETDLTSIIKSSQPLTEEHCQFFLYQLLRGLKYIHSANVVHRDLKPRNILVNGNCDLKICDFGLARALLPSQPGSKANVITDYVTTRWYRAPELLLSAREYTTSVDMWSVGCIFAQMLRRRPLLPGTDTRNEIQLICQFFGTPNIEHMKQFPEQSKKIIRGMPKRSGKSLQKIFGDASSSALDLIRKMLTFDPAHRITVDEALCHPYLEGLHSPEEEPVREKVSTIDFQFQNHNLTLQQLKDLLYEQILNYHFKQFYEEQERKKRKGQSLLTEILKSSNARLVHPEADRDDD